MKEHHVPNAFDILAALTHWASDAAPLLGVFESHDLEFKKTAYRLEGDDQRVEFAKDVAGMANAGGGVIVLGVETERDPAVGRDKTIRIRPLAPGSCNVQQMEDVARSWIYPPERGLRIREWPHPDGQSLLVSIEVPAFSDMGGLALILGPGDPPDRRTIGVPVRSEARVDFHLAAEVYAWIRAGRLRAALGAETGDSDGALVEGKHDAEAALERVRTEFMSTAPAGHAVFVLQAWPDSPTHLEQMFDHDGVMGLFLDPPAHRSAGFNWWGLRPEPDPPDGLRVSTGRISLWIRRSSVITLVVGQEYLTWAMDRYSTKPTINPTTLIEFTYEFCRLYLTVQGWCRPPTRHAHFRFGLLQALLPEAIRLAPGTPGGYGLDYSAHAATRDELLDEIGPVEVAGIAVENLTALVIRRFYELFGFGREDIPYLTDDGLKIEVSSIGGG